MQCRYDWQHRCLREHVEHDYAGHDQSHADELWQVNCLPVHHKRYQREIVERIAAQHARLLPERKPFRRGC